MKRIIAIALFLIAAPALASAQAERMQTEKSKSNNIEQELITLEKKWSEAYLKKDTATLDSIMADDIIIIYGDGTRGTKAKDIASVGIDEQIESNVLDDFQVRVYGDVAVVMSRLTAKGIRHGKRFSAQFRYFDLYEKRNGRWQCVATQNTHIGKVEL